MSGRNSPHNHPSTASRLNHEQRQAGEARHDGAPYGTGLPGGVVGAVFSRKSLDRARHTRGEPGKIVHQRVDRRDDDQRQKGGGGQPADEPDTVEAKATFEDPKQYPVGINYVIVNGKLVIDNGTHTGALPGRALKSQ